MAAAGAKWKSGKVTTAKALKVKADQKYNKTMLTKASNRARKDAIRANLGLPSLKRSAANNKGNARLQKVLGRGAANQQSRSAA